MTWRSPGGRRLLGDSPMLRPMVRVVLGSSTGARGDLPRWSPAGHHGSGLSVLCDGHQPSDTRCVRPRPIKPECQLCPDRLPRGLCRQVRQPSGGDQRAYGLDGRIKPTRSPSSAVAQDQVIDQLLRHRMPATRQPGDGVDGGCQIPCGISKPSLLPVQESDAERGWCSTITVPAPRLP